MSRYLTFPAGRRAKWVVAGVWLLLTVVALGANLPASSQGEPAAAGSS